MVLSENEEKKLTELKCPICSGKMEVTGDSWRSWFKCTDCKLSATYTMESHTSSSEKEESSLIKLIDAGVPFIKDNFSERIIKMILNPYAKKGSQLTVISSLNDQKFGEVVKMFWHTPTDKETIQEATEYRILRLPKEKTENMIIIFLTLTDLVRPKKRKTLGTKVDTLTKLQFETLCKSEGKSLNSAINDYVTQCIKEESLSPISSIISLDEYLIDSFIEKMGVNKMENKSLALRNAILNAINLNKK